MVLGVVVGWRLPRHAFVAAAAVAVVSALFVPCVRSLVVHGMVSF